MDFICSSVSSSCDFGLNSAGAEKEGVEEGAGKEETDEREGKEEREEGEGKEEAGRRNVGCGRLCRIKTFG